MKRLKPEIRALLRWLRPRGVGELMELAQMIEDKNTIEWVNRSSSVNFHTEIARHWSQTMGF